MKPATAGERSAIVVASVGASTLGLMVDRVSNILNVSSSDLHPVPAAAGFESVTCAEGIFARDKDMICFLNLDVVLANTDPDSRQMETAA